MKEQLNCFIKSIGLIRFELLGILILLFTTLVMAEADASIRHKLVVMTNEEDKELTHISIETDDDNNSIIKLIKSVYNKKGKLIVEDKFGPDKVGPGIVMKRASDRNIVVLRSNNFAIHNGGNIELDTLYNGVSDKRKSYNYELARAGENWELLNNENKKVSKMHFKSKKVVFVGTVGIKDIINK